MVKCVTVQNLTGGTRSVKILTGGISNEVENFRID